MRRHRWIVWFMASAMILAACGTTQKKAQAPVTPDAQVRVERVRLAGCAGCNLPNPFAANVRGNAQALMSLVFDSLAWKDPKNNVIPWLATKWENSADGKEWRFTLRDGVKWQDGQPLTAEDVAFTFDYVTKGPAGQLTTFGYRSIALKVKEARAEGTNVVVLQTETPDATFLDQVAVKVPIIPKHVWGSVTDPAKYADPPAMVGSGPYRLESFDSATGNYLFLANEDFWRGPPMVKRVEFLTVPDQLQALERGEIDVAEVGTATATEAQLKSFAPPKFDQTITGGTGATVLHFNMLKGVPFSDVRFRQAVAYAMNRPDMVKRLLLGHGQVPELGMILPNDSKWIPSDTAKYPYDPARAKALLDQAGLKDVDGDGRRELPNGDPFKPELLVDASINRLAVEVVQEYLVAVGIDVQIKSMDKASVDAAGNNAAYELALMTYGIGSDPEETRSYLWSKAPSTWWKAHGWNNAEFDAMMDAQRVQVNPAERARTAAAMQRLTADQVPVLPLYSPDRHAIFDTTVMTGWYYTEGGYAVYPGLVNKLTFVTPQRTGF